MFSRVPTALYQTMENVCCRMSKFWLPWLVGMPAETATAICSLLMGGVLHHFPRLKVCFAHGGGSFPYTVGRVQHGYNVRPDLCATDCHLPPRDFLGKFWTDSLVHDQHALQLLVDVIGEVGHLLMPPAPLGLHFGLISFLRSSSSFG